MQEWRALHPREANDEDYDWATRVAERAERRVEREEDKAEQRAAKAAAEGDLDGDTSDSSYEEISDFSSDDDAPFFSVLNFV